MNTYLIYFIDKNGNKRIISGGKSKEICKRALVGTSHESKDIIWSVPIYGYMGITNLYEGRIDED